MTIAHEADYQATLNRLYHLLDHEPGNVAEIMRLGKLVDAFENENGHRPLPANSVVARLEREMLARQMTPEQLADLLEIPVASLRAVLREQVRIDLDLARRLHHRLGISIEFSESYFSTQQPDAPLPSRPYHGGPGRVRG